MKVILLNGSPHEHGCTYTVLTEVAAALTDQGVDAQILHIGAQPIDGCSGCFACRSLGRCVKEDVVNRLADQLADADGMIIGTPVHFASPAGSLVALLDRLYAAHGQRLMYKPCGCIAAARRAGTTAALEVLHKYPLVNEQPLVPSCYWCMAYGTTPEEIRADQEGMEIARTLGRNMAWMVRSLRTQP